MKHTIVSFVFLVFALMGLCGVPACEQGQELCEPGEVQACYCSDETEQEHRCKKNGSGWHECDCPTYRIWTDPATGLSWQDPQKDAYKVDDPGLTQPDAIRYCEELVMGGYADWRLPDIGELRTLIRGNPGTVTNGECPVSDDSPKSDMFGEACGPYPDYQGPAEGGCYWDPELTGPCDKLDPAADGHPLETVSSTVASDDPFWVGCVLFDQGATAFNHLYSVGDVRCVRDTPTPSIPCDDGATAQTCVSGATRQCEAEGGKTGAQVCDDAAACWGPCEATGFAPSPPITGVCAECDQVTVTVHVPEKLTNPMEMLMVFLYRTDDFTIPPKRPPDGGIESNQVMDPDIDLGKPLTVTVPACSYYQDRCIPGGDYYLYVSLLQKEEMPPWPSAGDYVWGDEQPVLTLNAGQQQVIKKEITLIPWQQ